MEIKQWKPYGPLILTLGLILCHTLCLSAQETLRVLRSPSGTVNVKISLADGKLKYQVMNKQTEVILPSTLQWKIDDCVLGNHIENIEVEKGKKQRSSYTYIGAHSECNTVCKTYRLKAKERDGEDFFIEFRLYDNGVAFRYLTSRQQSVAVDDMTEFRLPTEGVTCWWQGNAQCYEGAYRETPMDKLPQNTVAGPPVTIKYPSGVYSLITEGRLVDFGGMALKVTAPGCLQSLLSGKETHKTGDIATPWRIVMTGNLNDLVNNDIISDVSDPLDPIFNGNTDWIQPGNCVWSWLAGYKVTLEDMKRFADWGAELGIRYNLVDEGWSHWEDKERGLDAWQMVKELVDYSNKKGVKTLLWKAYPDRKGIEGIQTAEKRRRFFKKCKELGVAGLKIDFFDNEDQIITRYYAETLKDAAEFGLIINFHGSNKPTGLSRTYPNEVTREGIKGLEYGRSVASENVITPFTRFVAGHADYTTMAFTPNRMGNTTEAHQIATTAVFLSPLRCYGGRPEDYVKHPARDIFLNIPTTWDETIVLPESEVGQCVLMARRKGTDWYVAGLTDKAKDAEVKLDFLGKGTYRADIISDGTDKKCSLSSSSYTNKDRLNISMKAGGGYLMRLVPDKKKKK